MRLSSLPIQISTAAFLSVMLAGNIFGQLGMATLGGTVSDASGALIPGAQVTLSNLHEQRKTVTNSVGQYVFSALLPGTYELSVTASGFEGKTIGGIVLTSGQGSTLNATLAVSSTKEAVTVTSAPPLLEATTATVGAVVSSQQFEALPMVHRNFTSLVATLPAVAVIGGPDTYAPSGALGDAINPSIYGQRQRDNNYILDGVENTQPLFGQIGIFPPPEAIAEMKVETGPDSGAVGWASGATINIVTKSGTNHYHGDAWDYFQNNALNARSFFDPSVLPLHYNQFGGTLGGPLVIPHLVSKAKAWYLFGYYEGIRRPQTSTFTALVPTADQLNGNLAGLPRIYDPYTTVAAPNGSVASRQPYPGNVIPASELNPTAQALAKAWYPAPNAAFNPVNNYNYIRSVPSDFYSDQWDVRADHQFGSKDTLYSRYSDWRTDSTGGSFPGLTGLNYNRVTNVSAGDTHVLNPTSVVTARFGFERIGTLSTSLMAGDLAKKYGFLSAFPAFMGTYDVLPTLYLDGTDFTRIGNESVSQNGPEYYWSGTVDSQLVRSRHTLGFGFGWIRTRFLTGHTGNYEDFNAPQTAFGPGTGDALASYLLGVPTDASRQAGNTFGSYFGNEFSFYAQDTFRATTKLTLNLGLRWDYAQPLQDRFGMGTFDWNTGTYYWDQMNPITHQPANIRPGGVAPDYNGFQPRFGIAYAIDPKTVVRSSFGIFDDTFGITAQSQSSGWGNWPFAFPQTEGSLNPTAPQFFIQNPFPGPPVGSPTPQGCNQCFNVDRSSSRNPYVEEWSLSLQRQLTSSLMAQVAYVGSHGVKLAGQLVDNTALYPGTTPLATRQLWPQFPPYILNGYNEFSSWYDGLSAELKKRLSNNLSLQVSYAWGHALDMEDSLSSGNALGAPNGNPTRFNVQDFKGPAGFDIRQVFSASYTYNIPWRPRNQVVNAVLGNWQLSGIVSADTGAPYWVVLSGDNENIGWVGRYNEYPNISCNPQANITPTRQEWFNTSCYQVPAYGTAGDAGRRGLTADGMFNWDSAFIKDWPFKEEKLVEFRAELFNLPNNHTFKAPSAAAGTPSFGEITCCSVRQPGRVVQLALKVHF